MNDGMDLSAGVGTIALAGLIAFQGINVFTIVLAALVALVTLVFFGYRAAVRSSGQPVIRTPDSDAAAARFETEDAA